uniref:Homeobox domain-containing protein n=1 Tax=Steinernema glaseri TaxID=37863 RepID=A0A1I8AX33_9BILA
MERRFAINCPSTVLCVYLASSRVPSFSVGRGGGAGGPGWRTMFCAADSASSALPLLQTPALLSSLPPLLPSPQQNAQQMLTSLVLQASPSVSPASPFSGDSLGGHLSEPLRLGPQLFLSAVPSTSRRFSASELDRPSKQYDDQKRRYSDFSVDFLLRPGRKRADSAEYRSPGRRHSFLEERLSCRKQRSIYGSAQTRELELAFESQQYVVGSEREQLAQKLGLSESQVRVWFQNRRSKWRKQAKAQTPSAL